MPLILPRQPASSCPPVSALAVFFLTPLQKVVFHHPFPPVPRAQDAVCDWGQERQRYNRPGCFCICTARVRSSPHTFRCTSMEVVETAGHHRFDMHHVTQFDGAIQTKILSTEAVTTGAFCNASWRPAAAAISHPVHQAATHQVAQYIGIAGEYEFGHYYTRIGWFPGCHIFHHLGKDNGWPPKSRLQLEASPACSLFLPAYASSMW